MTGFFFCGGAAQCITEGIHWTRFVPRRANTSAPFALHAVGDARMTFSWLSTQGEHVRTFPSFLRNHGTGDPSTPLRSAQDDNARTFSVILGLRKDLCHTLWECSRFTRCNRIRPCLQVFLTNLREKRGILLEHVPGCYLEAGAFSGVTLEACLRSAFSRSPRT